MKQELEAYISAKKFLNIIFFFFEFSEYLAMFKKTVSMHEVFLQRLAAHPVLRNDNNFRVFLEYKEDVKKIIKSDKRFLCIKILFF